MKPSIGRIVIFKIPGSLAGQRGECPGVITQVWSDNCVNLHLLPDIDQVTTVRGMPQGHTPSSVTYSEAKGDRTWCWPPRVEDSPTRKLGEDYSQ